MTQVACHMLGFRGVDARLIIVGPCFHPMAFKMPRLEMTSDFKVWLTALISDSAKNSDGTIYLDLSQLPSSVYNVLLEVTVNGEKIRSSKTLVKQ